MSLWLSIQLKEGPKSLKKTFIKVVDRNETVGDVLEKILEDDKRVVSVGCHPTDPDKLQNPASEAATVPVDMPLSVVVENFGARFLVVHLKPKNEATPPPKSIFDVLMNSDRHYDKYPERR